MKFSLHTLSSLLHYGKRLKPSRDWLALLGLSLCLFILSIVWNVWTFVRLTQGEALGASVVVEDTSSSEDALRTIFKTRATEGGRYKNEYHFIDPSHSGG